MTSSLSPLFGRRFGRLCRGAPLAAALAALLAASPSHALYKVVAPDKSVTYTDRPGVADGNISPVGNGAAPASEAVPLPFELQRVATRYPVVLYASQACNPCEAARQLLRQRGVPYVEKRLSTAVDGEALRKLSGGTELPTLTIGAQALRGLAPDVWNSYLDSAGYPATSRLPANYQFPPPVPMTEIATTPAAPVSADQPPFTEPLSSPTPASPSGIRF